MKNKTSLRPTSRLYVKRETVPSLRQKADLMEDVGR